MKILKENRLQQKMEKFTDHKNVTKTIDSKVVKCAEHKYIKKLHPSY